MQTHRASASVLGRPGAYLEAGTGRSMLAFNRDDYGLGVKRFVELKPHRAYGHTGLLNTYTAMLVHLPADDVTLDNRDLRAQPGGVRRRGVARGTPADDHEVQRHAERSYRPGNPDDPAPSAWRIIDG